jgi:5-formyltetrahydrofolate cyclo-ligase
MTAATENTPTVYTKDTMRQKAFSRRVQMPQAERKQLSQQIAENFFAHVPLPPAGSVVSAYSPINGEVDVRDIMKRLAGMGYVCTLPYVTDNEQRLSFLKWTEDTPLRNSIYGIPEPDPKTAQEFMPDFLIMPILAFDEQGHRLGYGSGNFDRTFAFLKKIKPFKTVAVAYEEQKYDSVPVDAHDYPMDMVVTEKRVYDFGGVTT